MNVLEVLTVKLPNKSRGLIFKSRVFGRKKNSYFCAYLQYFQKSLNYFVMNVPRGPRGDKKHNKMPKIKVTIRDTEMTPAA